MDLLDGAACLLQACCLSAISNYLLRVTPSEEGLVFEVVKADLHQWKQLSSNWATLLFQGYHHTLSFPLAGYKTMDNTRNLLM